MTTNRSLASPLPLLMLALLAAPAVSHAQYQAFDLGVLTGGTGGKAFGINNAGYITGYAYTSASANPHAFLYNGNTLGPLIDLGTTGGLASNGYGLNNNNVVVGNSVSVANATSPLRAAYFNPTARDLAPTAGTSGVLRGINDNGLAVGYSNTGNTAVTYQYQSSGGATTLTSLAPALGNPAVSQAYGVNNSGQIVGYYGPTAGSNQVYTYNTATSTLTNLGTLGGVSATSDANGGGYGINASGQIACYSKTSTGALHAAYYNGAGSGQGSLLDLGTLIPGSNAPTGSGAGTSTAYSINTQGDIVGNSNFVGGPAGNVIGAFHAYVYKHGSTIGYDPANGNTSSLIDLNLVTTNLAAAGFNTLNLAYSINDSGWIVGQGVTTSGQSHAFLLKPVSSVPEPGSIALLMGLGVSGAALLRRRARK